MSKLFYRPKTLIGLDISQTGIKIMSIDSKRWLVSGYGSLDLDPVKVQTSLDSTDDPYLSNSIRELLQKSTVGTLASDQVVVGLPTSKSFSRSIIVPAKAEAHIKDAVEVAIEEYIPIPRESLYYDYKIVERSKENLTVVMSAVPKLLIDSCLRAVRAAGLTPLVLEPSINAVARVLKSTEEGNLSTLIVDIGATSTDIAVLSAGVIRVTGGVGIGGNTFTLDIAKKLNIALENAHQYKVLNGLSPGPRQAKIAGALRPSLTRIASEIRKVIRYYNERLSDNHKIEQVIIVGGGANVPGVGDFFTNELVMPARVASPWQKLDFGSLPQPNKQFRPRYITVAGLASVQTDEVWK